MDHNGISIWLGSILVYESNDIYLKIIGIFLRILRGDPHENQLFGSYDLPMEWFDLSPMFVWWYTLK